MSRRLASLRRALDALPSPVADQWNIDPASVVRFAALAFGAGAGAGAARGEGVA
jgi:hypothetical protein